MDDAVTFASRIAQTDPEALRARSISSVMLNLGLRCQLECVHCHVSASPERVEAMDEPTMQAALRFVRQVRPELVEITGGAPELHPRLRWLISELRISGLRVRLRTNLAALFLPEVGDLAAYLAAAEVDLLGSFPGPSAFVVDSQRGPGVRDASMEALWRLNALGYGTRLRLDLAHNPDGPQLPEARDLIERRYRAVLSAEGIAFNDVIVIANVPVGRFGESLHSEGIYETYLDMLRCAFSPKTARFLECRDSIDIGWDGTIWDCDFNLGGGLPSAEMLNVKDADPTYIATRTIAFGDHCYACTAAAGSG